MNLKTYTKKERNVFLSGLAGQNIIFNIMIVFTSFFLVHVLYIPALMVGVLLVITQVFDAVTDPFMGILVDRTKTRWGKCRPWLIFTPALIFLFVMLSFSGGVYQYGDDASALRNAGIVVWITVAYLLWGIIYMAGDITLWGITSLMTENEEHRKNLQALARLSALIGGGIGMLGFQPVALALSDAFGNLRMGFLVTALIFGLVAFVAYQLVGLFVKEKVAPPPMNTNAISNFKMAWNNKPFRRVLLSGVLAAPRNIILIVAFPLITYYFANFDPALVFLYTVIIGGGFMAGNALILPFVPKLLQRWRKKTLYNWSLLADVPCSLAAFALYLVVALTGVPDGMANIWALTCLAAILTVKGVCMGIFSVLQTNMITDAVDYEEYMNHRRPDGFFFSGQTFIIKVGNGINNLLFLSLSAAVAFSGQSLQILQSFERMAEENYEYLAEQGIAVLRDVAQAGYHGVVLSLDGVGELTGNRVFWFFAMMFFTISVVPAISAALAVIPTLKYELTEEKHEEILQELQQRRRENETD